MCTPRKTNRIVECPVCEGSGENQIKQSASSHCLCCLGRGALLKKEVLERQAMGTSILKTIQPLLS